MTSLHPTSAVFIIVFLSNLCQVARCQPQNPDIFSELGSAIPGINGRLEASLKGVQEQLEAQLAEVMTQLNNQKELQLVPDIFQDFNGTKLDETSPQEVTFHLSPNAVSTLSKNITDSLSSKIEKIIEDKITSTIQSIATNHTNDVLEEIRNLDATYSKVYKKLFQYTRHQFATLAAQFEKTGNVTEPQVLPLRKDKVPRDCAEAKTLGRKTGVTKIQVEGLEYDQHVWCDQDTEGGGWTVFLRRLPMGENQLDFKKTYEEYRKPFGEASTEYWLGLDALHHITSTYGHDYMLRAEVKRGDEEAFSEWNYFKVDDDLYRYKMHVRDFSDLSTAGDAMEYHSGMEFSAYDSDNDKASGGSCSAWSGQGGWWYNYCYYSNPTGIYPPSDITETTEADHFLEWRKWQGYYVYLTHHSLMIRPN